METTHTAYLRDAVARIQQEPNVVRRRYPAAVRQEVLSYAKQRMARGASQRRVATELGISFRTLGHWIRGENGPFRPVKRKSHAGRPSSSQAKLAAAGSALRLKTPQGFQIEGLSVSDLVAVLKSLA